MQINEAVKIAIKGGFGKQYPSHWDLTDSDTISKEKFLLNPEFWKCLGKALGWNKAYCPCGLEADDKNTWVGWCNNHQENMLAIDEWKYHAHQFLELRMTGGDESKFWTDLLT